MAAEAGNMRPVRSRGSAPGASACWAVVCLMAALFVFLNGAGTAHAAPSQSPFNPSRLPVQITAVGPDGTSTIVSVLVQSCDLLPTGNQAPEWLPALPAGEAYFYVWLQPVDPVGGAPFVPLNFATNTATLVTAGGTVAAVDYDPSYTIDAQFWFPVADSITRATLVIGATTVDTFGPTGTPITYAIRPTTIEFVSSPPDVVPVPNESSAPPSIPGSSLTPLTVTTASGSSSAVGVGLGVLIVLGAGGAALVSLRRRRAFYRADREGRVVLVGPPLLAARPTAADLPGDDEAGAGKKTSNGSTSFARTSAAWNECCPSWFVRMAVR